MFINVSDGPVYRVEVRHECGHLYRSDCGWNTPAAAHAHGAMLLLQACSTCRDRREPQGDAVRLFEPAPAVMPGQTSMADDVPLWEQWHAVRPDPPHDSPLWPEERIRAAYRSL